MSNFTCDKQASAKVRGRYHREIVVAALVYVAVIFVSATRRLSPPGWVSVLMALVALAPVVMMLDAYRRFIAGLDEFQRRVQSDALAMATGIVGFACLTYGFLESFAGFPPIEGALIWVLPAITIVQGLAQVFIRRRYQ